MAIYFLLPLLSGFRFVHQFLLRLAQATVGNRWLSLALNFVGCVLLATVAFALLPEWPVVAMVHLIPALILFGCFVADVLMFVRLGALAFLSHRRTVRHATLVMAEAVQAQRARRYRYRMPAENARYV